MGLKVIAAYEVRWHWQGDVESHRYSDCDQAVAAAELESRDWIDDTVQSSTGITRRRHHKRVSVVSVVSIRRDGVRQTIGVYEAGELLPVGEWR